MKHVGAQAKTLVKSVTKLSKQLGDINNKRLEREKYLTMGKHGPWYSKISEGQARKEAEKKVARMIKNYQVDVTKLRRNINYLQTLLNFNSQSGDLLHFYSTQTKIAEEKTQNLRKKAAVDHRLSTFYNRKDSDTSPWNYYLYIIYWIVFSLIVILFIKDLYGSYKHGTVTKGVKQGLIAMVMFIFLPLFIIPLLKRIKNTFLPYYRP